MDVVKINYDLIGFLAVLPKSIRGSENVKESKKKKKNVGIRLSTQSDVSKLPSPK